MARVRSPLTYKFISKSFQPGYHHGMAHLPEKKLQLTNIFFLALAHALALSLFHFSPKALGLCLGGVFILAPLGINLGFHRLLTHRSLKTPKWLEYILVTLGAVIGGGPPLHWVAEHRLHHRFSDSQSDPHDATEGFWHSHIAHLFYHKAFEDQQDQWTEYIPDLITDRYYRFLNKAWIPLALLVLVPLYWWGGVSYVLWAGFVRFILTMHIMWLVNSASHLWGYRNYETRDAATNCWWVGIFAAGEGWHNNHHAYPTSAAHGHHWWEFDLTYGIICLLERLGLATEVKRPAF